MVVHHNRVHDEEEEEGHSPPDDFDLYLELFGGPSYVDLRAIKSDNYYPTFVQLNGYGGGGGAALGVRFEFISFGVRGSLSHYDIAGTSSRPASSFDIGTAAAEVTLSLPLPVFRPFLRAGFGLGWHGDAGVKQAWGTMSVPNDIQTTVFGWVFQGAVGFDVYLADWFSLGAAFSVDIFNMSRHGWSSVPDPSTASSVDFARRGDAIGIQGRGQLSAGFHFF